MTGRRIRCLRSTESTESAASVPGAVVPAKDHVSCAGRRALAWARELERADAEHRPQLVTVIQGTRWTLSVLSVIWAVLMLLAVAGLSSSPLLASVGAAGLSAGEVEPPRTDCAAQPGPHKAEEPLAGLRPAGCLNQLLLLHGAAICTGWSGTGSAIYGNQSVVRGRIRD